MGAMSEVTASYELTIPGGKLKFWENDDNVVITNTSFHHTLISTRKIDLPKKYLPEVIFYLRSFCNQVG